MIATPDYTQIISKLKENGLSESEIEEKIDNKMKQLSGLISKDGAVHIIANELGIKVFEEIGEIKIGNAKNGMRNVSLNGKITIIFGIREFKNKKREGRVGSFLIGDDSGTIRVVLWNESHLKEMEDKIREELIVRVENGYIKENNGYKEIHLGNQAKLILNPAGVTIDSVVQNKINGVEKNIKDLSENDKNVSIKGTIVQLFDPRFYEICNECGRRAKPENGEFKCLQHGQVTPGYGSVINCILDDGTENIRVVCFKEQAAKLLGVDNVNKFKDNPAEFESLKNEALGRQVKIDGRVTKNEMFDRIEFVSNNVEELNPENILNR